MGWSDVRHLFIKGVDEITPIFETVFVLACHCATSKLCQGMCHHYGARHVSPRLHIHRFRPWAPVRLPGVCFLTNACGPHATTSAIFTPFPPVQGSKRIHPDTLDSRHRRRSRRALDTPRRLPVRGLGRPASTAPPPPARRRSTRARQDAGAGALYVALRPAQPLPTRWPRAWWARWGRSLALETLLCGVGWVPPPPEGRSERHTTAPRSVRTPPQGAQNGCQDSAPPAVSPRTAPAPRGGNPA